MTSLAVFGMSGHWEVLLILVVILLLFGGRKLPELARALGKSLSEFKRGREEEPKPSIDEGGESKTKDSENA